MTTLERLVKESENYGEVESNDKKWIAKLKEKPKDLLLNCVTIDLYFYDKVVIKTAKK